VAPIFPSGIKTSTAKVSDLMSTAPATAYQQSPPLKPIKPQRKVSFEEAQAETKPATFSMTSKQGRSNPNAAPDEVLRTKI